MGHSEGKTGGGEAPPTTTRGRGGNDDLEAHLLEEDRHQQQGLDGVPAPLLENRLPTPQTDSLLYVCAVLSIVSALGSVLCMVVNLISLLRSFDYRGFDYRVSVLEYWVGRGMLQIFVAVLTKELAQASGETQAESVMHDIASWWLLICGIIYTAAGLLCIGRIKRSHLSDVTRRQQAIKDLEEVHRRRAELEAQIGEHR
ncbi:hypothetical protein CY35_09G078700 [Sphagnum magellanicum]|nr:hypothetical protein CY35_09G078700 [Sphagnum magellanicum]